MEIATIATEERQQGLNDLVMNKIARKIENGAVTVEQTFAKLEAEGKSMRDFVVPTSNLQFMFLNGVQSIFPVGEQPVELGYTDFSMGQLAEKFRIPGGYLRELARTDEWSQRLAVTILNEHRVHGKRERLLIREVNGQVRGVLSDHYRRLNSQVIVEKFILAATAAGGVFVDGHIDDRKLWLECLIPTPINVPTERNGVVSIAFGVRLSTSDFGDGSLELRSFILQGVCLNGLVTESAMKQIHLGSKLPDNMLLSEQTYRLDSETTASAVKDITDNLLSAPTFEAKARLIQTASERALNLETGVKELIKLGMTKEETGAVEAVFMNNNPEDGVAGEGSLWKLAQGVSAVARDAEARRRRELEEIAGNILLRK